MFRLCEKAPDILREVCLERGWEEYSENGGEADGDWNLWWKTQGFTSGEFERCRPWQRLNHFPKSTNITKKDGLARNLRRMRTSYGGSMFEFFHSRSSFQMSIKSLLQNSLSKMAVSNQITGSASQLSSPVAEEFLYFKIYMI